MGHDVFSPQERQRSQGVYAYHKDSDTKLELERVNKISELPVELVHSSLSALEQIGNLMDKIAKTEHPKRSGTHCSKPHEISAKRIVSIEFVWWRTAEHATTVSAGI